MPIKVLITGVTGLIGNFLWTDFRNKPDLYDIYGLTRRLHPSERIRSGVLDEVPEDRWHVADVSHFDGVKQAVKGMDVVIHMAANPRPEATMEELVPGNIMGAYNVFEACRLAGVKRVIFASTIWVSLGYQYDEPYKTMAEGRYDELSGRLPIVTHESATRPAALYPCTKIWGEALGRYYSDAHGMSVVCIRIGAVENGGIPDKHVFRVSWCSRRDLVQLVEKCVQAPGSLRYEIFYGVSDNKYRFVDIDNARKVVGYVPQDSIESRVAML